MTAPQWKLLLGVAKANETHGEPPRLKGQKHGTCGVLVRLGLLEPGGRRVTDKGWFFVRDEISSGRRQAEGLALSTTPGMREVDSRYTLDGEPLGDIEDFISVNTAEDSLPLSEVQVAAIRAMNPGDSMILGGGAAAEFLLKREE